MALYRMISSYIIYRLTKSWIRVFTQLMDLELFRILYVSHKYKISRKSSPQRLIAMLESVFEAAPQALLQLIFVMKIDGWNSIILSSVILSLFNLTSSTISDDKMLEGFTFDRSKTPLNWKDKLKTLPWLYVFRLCDIPPHLLCLCVLWIFIDGYTLTIVICIDCFIVLIVYWITKCADALMGLVALPLSLGDTNLGMLLMGAFWWYRMLWIVAVNITLWVYFMRSTKPSDKSILFNTMDWFASLPSSDKSPFVISLWLFASLASILKFPIIWGLYKHVDGKWYETAKERGNMAAMCEQTLYSDVMELMFYIHISPKSSDLVMDVNSSLKKCKSTKKLCLIFSHFKFGNAFVLTPTPQKQLIRCLSNTLLTDQRMAISTFNGFFLEHQKEFRSNRPFASFFPPKEHFSAQGIANRINKAIINTLQDITQKQVELDVAFSEIYELFCYVTRNLHSIFPEFVDKTFIGYHKFFFYFLIFGCCLGNEYAKYIALTANDEDYQSNEALRYLIDTFIPNLNQSNMKYKYCNLQRTATVNALKTHHDLHGDILHLITEFTVFPFEEFLIKVLALNTPLWDSKVEFILHQLSLFCRTYSPKHTATLFIFPEFLLTPSFMRPCAETENDRLWNNIQYFADVLQFKLISMSYTRGFAHTIPRLIQKMYEVPHLTSKPWTDPIAFIELFEMLPSECRLEDLFAKCVDIECSEQPLSVFYNGHNYQQNRGETIEHKEMESIYHSMDSLFEEFLMKYFISNIRIMNNMFYQIVNSLSYFLQLNVNNHNALKLKLIRKLVHVTKRTVVPYIDYSEFMNTPKYKQSLDNLTQIETFDTNLFDGNKKRTMDQVEGVMNQNTQSLKRIKLLR
eukprot:40541_1